MVLAPVRLAVDSKLRAATACHELRFRLRPALGAVWRDLADARFRFLVVFLGVFLVAARAVVVFGFVFRVRFFVGEIFFFVVPDAGLALRCGFVLAFSLRQLRHLRARQSRCRRPGRLEQSRPQRRRPPHRACFFPCLFLHWRRPFPFRPCSPPELQEQRSPLRICLSTIENYPLTGFPL